MAVNSIPGFCSPETSSTPLHPGGDKQDVLAESHRSTLPGSSTQEAGKEKTDGLVWQPSCLTSQQARIFLDQPVKYHPIAKCSPHFFRLQLIPILLHPLGMVLAHLSEQMKVCAVLG